MPVTKTAKRALGGSKRKQIINKTILSGVEIAMRKAKKSRKSVDITHAIALVDRAAKKHVFHKNKASRIKSTLSQFLPPHKPNAKASKKAL